MPRLCPEPRKIFLRFRDEFPFLRVIRLRVLSTGRCRIGSSADRREQFEELALPHVRSLLRTAARVSSDAATAEDLVQDAILRAWASFEQFEPGTNFKAWLFKILLNLWSTRRKRALREA